MIVRTIFRLIDAAMNSYAPITNARNASAFADVLSECEANVDSWDPHGDNINDELWAALQRHPAGKRQHHHLSRPADVDVPPASPPRPDAADVGGVDHTVQPPKSTTHQQEGQPEMSTEHTEHTSRLPDSVYGGSDTHGDPYRLKIGTTPGHNAEAPALIHLFVGAIHIATTERNWKRIFAAMQTVDLPPTAPTTTHRIVIDDTARTATVHPS